MGRDLEAWEGKAFPLVGAEISADPFCGEHPATPP